MNKTIRNLINKYGVNQLHKIIDNEHSEMKSQTEYEVLVNSNQNVIEWFEQWAQDNNLKLKNNLYNGNMIYVDGWRSDGPYVYLWLARDDEHNRASFEIGSSIYDIWPSHSMSNIKSGLAKVLKLRQKHMEEISVFDDGNPVNGKESYDS